MLQKSLNNIANRFLKENLVTEKKIIKNFDQIDTFLKIAKIDFFLNPKTKIDYKKHFHNIEILRENIINLKPKWTLIEVENKINLFLSYFIPNQEDLNLMLNDTDKPYELLEKVSLLSYYIKSDKNEKNLYWNYKSEFGKLVISINKAKPEKTIEQIMAAKKQNKKSDPNKPKCVICVENIGYSADSQSDLRENLRAHFIDLNNDKWFFQYSPYSYLKKHFVLNYLIHRPMKVSNKSIENLINFVDVNPQYFLGSNADLPIVGGSLLSHDHYQGGAEDLPIVNAKIIDQFKIDNTKISILNWPLNTLKLTSKNKEEILSIGNYFLNSWKNLDNGIIENKNNNTITLIANKKNNEFNLFLIYRNNTTSKERPLGNFHVHQDKFNIKQENIGLMEAAGLAILPARLERELKHLFDIYKKGNVEEIKSNNDLSKHYDWFQKLLKIKKYIKEKDVFDFASETFKNGLKDCKVLDDNIFQEYISSLINDEIFLENDLGMKVAILKHGFTIKSISYNQKKYLMQYKQKHSYYSNSILLNAFVGPVAGRIQSGNVLFSNNKKIKLPIDNKNNYIHSMDYNCAFMDFNFSKINNSNNSSFVVGVKKIYNEDLKSNYSFLIKAELKNNTNEFILSYEIKSDDFAIANPTQHFYFQFNNDYNILDYQLNINEKDFKWWSLSENLNPLKIKKFNLHKEWNSIKDISNSLGEEQQEIVGGLIDHPFVNVNQKNIILKNKESSISISGNPIRDFVVYTHNFPGKEEIAKNSNKYKNNGICIEMQNVPTSKKNYNFEEIEINKNKIYKNKILLKIIE